MSGFGPPSFGADRPLENPEDDRLGHAAFAARIAEAILALPAHQGFVVGIYGPWGSGKTSVLNFVRRALEGEAREGRPLVVRFDPWWFAGEGSLAGRFFEELLVATGGWAERGRRTLERLRELAEVVSEAPLPYAGWARIVRRRKERSLTVAKERVVRVLQEGERRIVVIIDDVDRISAEEMRDLFRLIRAVADFPNVTYLVALDRAVAVSALGRIQEGSGEDFLAKIVQVPFELPPPDQAALAQILSGHLEAILPDTPTLLAGEPRLPRLYSGGLSALVRTPRDVARLANALSLTYGPVRGEVNAADFVALEGLRLFAPTIYDLVRRHPGEFAGSPRVMEGWEPEIDRGFHEAWLAEQPMELRQPLKRLLLEVFPRLQAVWGGGGPLEDDRGRWARELRAANRRVLPIYFRLAVPSGSVARAELMAILALTEDRTALEARFAELAAAREPAGSPRSWEVLARLGELAPEMSSEQAAALVGAVCEVGDRFLADEEPGARTGRLGAEVPRDQLVDALLPRVASSARAGVLEAAFRSGLGLATIVDLAVMLGWEHGKYGGSGPAGGAALLTLEQQEALEAIALRRIREAAGDGALIDSPRLAHLLHRWRQWGAEAGEAEVRRWVQEVIRSDEGLLRLLENYLSRGSVASAWGSRNFYRLDPRSFQDVLEVPALCRRARSLLGGGASPSPAQRLALAQLVRECSALEQGLDPADLDWTSPSAQEEA
jgi:predicted KAP-like P-loop ATPase